MKSRSRVVVAGLLAVIVAVLGIVYFTDAVTAEATTAANTVPDNISKDIPVILGFDESDGKVTSRTSGITPLVQPSIKVAINTKAAGKLIVRVGEDPLGETTVAAGSTATVQIESIQLSKSLREGGQRIFVDWKPTPAASATQTTATSEGFDVTLDTTGPQLHGVELVDLPGAGLTLRVTFADDDIKASTATTTSFKIQRENAQGGFSDTLATDNVAYNKTPEVSGNTVELFLGALPAGLYRLTVTDALWDELDNHAGGTGASGNNQQRKFYVTTEPQRHGEHVEFPPFAPPTKQAIPAEGYQPADFVTTRVSRLYYYRNAERVAQILNRRVRALNAAAKNVAQKRAEQARTDANQSIDDRRAAERAAVRAAQETRQAEQNLEAVRAVMAETTSLGNRISTLQAQSNEKARELGVVVPADPEARKTAMNAAAADVTQKELTLAADPQDGRKKNEVELAKQRVAQFNELLRIDDEIAKLQSVKGRLPDASDGSGLATRAKDLEDTVARLRQTEIQKQEASDKAEAAELRATQHQFREKVNAETIDLDTYVAGKVKSIDPVTQVSISVIGEGLLHFRGPVRGINKLRIMVNQIDSPVGQIKIGIITIQVNGEKGDKMEEVVGNIEGHIDLGRFLTNQSLSLLRKAIQTEAALVAAQSSAGEHYQVDRDRRYVYNFFGRDFIDELYAMDSEFLHTENKLLSLHSMDTSSLNRALFVLALAKNDVRQRILARFFASAKDELAEAEFDFRRSSELRPHRTQKKVPPWNLTHLPIWNKRHREVTIHEAVLRNARQRYHFRNIRGFFDGPECAHPDIMNPTQRQFIRLAQIFKARMVAELELHQRVIERGLTEDPSNMDEEQAELLKPVNEKAMKMVAEAYQGWLDSHKDVDKAVQEAGKKVALAVASDNEYDRFEGMLKQAETMVLDEAFARRTATWTMEERKQFADRFFELAKSVDEWEKDKSESRWATARDRALLVKVRKAIDNPDIKAPYDRLKRRNGDGDIDAAEVVKIRTAIEFLAGAIDLVNRKALTVTGETWKKILVSFRSFRAATDQNEPDMSEVSTYFNELDRLLESLKGSPAAADVLALLNKAYDAVDNRQRAEQRIKRAKYLTRKTRRSLNHRKLLDYLIAKQEDKFIELVEGTRSHIAVMDNYLKRLAIAIEDDLKVQFYDPAMVRIRDAARSDEVTLGAVERTTILTNNRAFARVSPSATMEFDLPKRQIAIIEAIGSAKALMQDAGALMNDPTFITAFRMMGGDGRRPNDVVNVLPGQSSSNNSSTMGMVPPPSQQGQSALEKLIPPPAIYKIETGTGFQIRPVILPDGDSVIYDFDYMYSTPIREPVRADEKHLGRIKRHFVHTQVQTSSFELREISRYQVALKVARTGKGVPGLENIPFIGAAFKPAPSAESSIQQNIILGQTTVYPTLFDLMGLRWASHVAELDHAGLLDANYITRGRQMVVDQFIQDEAADRFDALVGIKNSDRADNHYRPDLHHGRREPSRYHPSGYRFDGRYRDNNGDWQRRSVIDPTGRQFERSDRRPGEMQQPAYERHRHRPVSSQQIGPLPTANRSNQRRISPTADSQAPPNQLRLRPLSHLGHGAYQTGRQRHALREVVQVRHDNVVSRGQSNRFTGNRMVDRRSSPSPQRSRTAALDRLPPVRR